MINAERTEFLSFRIVFCITTQPKILSQSIGEAKTKNMSIVQLNLVANSPAQAQALSAFSDTLRPRLFCGPLNSHVTSWNLGNFSPAQGSYL